jgi:hypothetical protein
MVAHQYLRVDEPTGALTSLAKSAQKRASILVVPINSFPPITAIQYVIDGSRIFDAYFTRQKRVTAEALSRSRGIHGATGTT